MLQNYFFIGPVIQTTTSCRSGSYQANSYHISFRSVRRSHACIIKRLAN